MEPIAITTVLICAAIPAVFFAWLWRRSEDSLVRTRRRLRDTTTINSQLERQSRLLSKDAKIGREVKAQRASALAKANAANAARRAARAK